MFGGVKFAAELERLSVFSFIVYFTKTFTSQCAVSVYRFESDKTC